MLLRIRAPHFTAGIVVGERAAPIIGRMRDWSTERIETYCASKGWSVSRLPDRWPRVLNIKRVGRVPGAVYCGRGSPYGNRYRIGPDGSRDDVCDLFERHQLPGLDVTALRGRYLLCFCKPLRCHCDPILLKANPGLDPEVYDLI